MPDTSYERFTNERLTEILKIALEHKEEQSITIIQLVREVRLLTSLSTQLAVILKRRHEGIPKEVFTKGREALLKHDQETEAMVYQALVRVKNMGLLHESTSSKKTNT